MASPCYNYATAARQSLSTSNSLRRSVTPLSRSSIYVCIVDCAPLKINPVFSLIRGSSGNTRPTNYGQSYVYNTSPYARPTATFQSYLCQNHTFPSAFVSIHHQKNSFECCSHELDLNRYFLLILTFLIF